MVAWRSELASGGSLPRPQSNVGQSGRDKDVVPDLRRSGNRGGVLTQAVWTVGWACSVPYNNTDVQNNILNPVLGLGWAPVIPPRLEQALAGEGLVLYNRPLTSTTPSLEGS